MRVLHIVSQRADFAYSLSRGERALGLISNVLATRAEPLCDIALGIGSATEVSARIRAGLQAPLNYDVLHYHGDSLFSWNDLSSPSPHRFLDLRVAKAMGRRIIFTLTSSVDSVMTETILPLYADRVFRLPDVAGPGEPLDNAWLGSDALAEAMVAIYTDVERPLDLK